MQRLPGIINIYYVLASSLMASITQKALADAPVGVFADTFLIPHIGDAVCKMETQFDNNDTLEKVKLSFSTTSQLPAREHLVPYHMLVVQPFFPTTDPRVVGITPVPNIDDRIRKLTQELTTSHPDTENIEYEQADLVLDDIFKPEDNDEQS